jgi:hypothetical protein
VMRRDQSEETANITSTSYSGSAEEMRSWMALAAKFTFAIVNHGKRVN